MLRRQGGGKIYTVRMDAAPVSQAVRSRPRRTQREFHLGGLMPLHRRDAHEALMCTAALHMLTLDAGDVRRAALLQSQTRVIHAGRAAQAQHFVLRFRFGEPATPLHLLPKRARYIDAATPARHLAVGVKSVAMQNSRPPDHRRAPGAAFRITGGSRVMGCRRALRHCRAGRRARWRWPDRA